VEVRQFLLAEVRHPVPRLELEEGCARVGDGPREFVEDAAERAAIRAGEQDGSDVRTGFGCGDARRELLVADLEAGFFGLHE
jgi:hypothetical protein